MKKQRKWRTTLLLCLFLGCFGAHRFYTGKKLTAVAMLCTLGAFGIWTLIDLFFVYSGKFRDAEGRLLTKTAKNKVR
jgi:TM2 domain-containing membrane protein YozV